MPGYVSPEESKGRLKKGKRLTKGGKTMDLLASWNPEMAYKWLLRGIGLINCEKTRKY